VPGLVIGLGAQALIRDLLTGIFLLFEGLVAVGDVIQVGAATGTVESIGLRVTKLRLQDGSLRIVPNGGPDGVSRASARAGRAPSWRSPCHTTSTSIARWRCCAGSARNGHARRGCLDAPAVEGIMRFSGGDAVLRLTSGWMPPVVSTQRTTSDVGSERRSTVSISPRSASDRGSHPCASAKASSPRPVSARVPARDQGPAQGDAALVDKPTIQYVVEEAVASGLQEIIIVHRRGKRAIEDHFDAAFELEYYLNDRGKVEELAQIKTNLELASVSYVRQKEPLGLGHAILCARALVGEEPFGVFLGDDIHRQRADALHAPAARRLRAPPTAASSPFERVPRERIHQYGVIAGRNIGGNVWQIDDLVEKPRAEDAPSDLAIIGRYVLTPTCSRSSRRRRPTSVARSS